MRETEKSERKKEGKKEKSRWKRIVMIERRINRE
jgi:hypothetical protein